MVLIGCTIARYCGTTVTPQFSAVILFPIQFSYIGKSKYSIIFFNPLYACPLPRLEAYRILLELPLLVASHRFMLLLLPRLPLRYDPCRACVVVMPRSSRSLDADIDTCEMAGCDGSARFGHVSSLLPSRCLKHTEHGMVEVTQPKSSWCSEKYSIVVVYDRGQ